MRHLTLVFERLKNYGLILNTDKCIFDVDEIVFLGHKVNREGVAPLESKVTAIQNFPRPSNMKQLGRFLGMLNYYQRFIPAAAATLQHLNRMLSPPKYSRQALRWNEEAEEVFSAIKTELASATLLAFPVLGAETQLVVDASISAVSRVLQQVIDGHAKPLAFFSPVAPQLRAPPKVSARAPAHRSYHFRGVKLKSCIKKIHHNLYISKQANVRIKHADTEGASHKKFGTDARVQ